MGTMQHPAVRQRYTGVISLWNEPRYFGFIKASQVLPTGQESIFVHRLNMMKGMPSPSVGDQVEFEIGPPYKLGGTPQAVRVKILNLTQEIQHGLAALAKGQGGVA